MADDGTHAETLAEFKDSFFYGSRSNLNVKFLANLAAERAGDFFAEMVAGISDLIDDGDPASVIERFIEWQRAAYAPHDEAKSRFSHDEGAFTPLAKPLGESRVALVIDGQLPAGVLPRRAHHRRVATRHTPRRPNRQLIS